MKDDKRSGFGVLTRPGLYKYSGEWENNYYNGKGEFIDDEKGYRYIGGFKN